MTKIAVFAHYDKNNMIEDYVIYLLKEVAKVVDYVLFVSDTDLPEKELYKINNDVIIVCAKHHGEYDFGSYKRGYLYAYENDLLDDCEQLILINDSCYGPLYPLNEMFEVMNSKKLDVWGITTGFNTHFGSDTHIQSYFVAMIPTVFQNDTFKKFITSIKKEEDKMNIVYKYEIGLTKCFDSIGAKRDVYSKYSKNNWASYILSYEYLVQKERIPFIKRCLALSKTDCYVNLNYFYNLISKISNYNVNYIKQDVLENREKTNLSQLIRIFYKFVARYFLFLYRKLFFNNTMNYKTSKQEVCDEISVK